MSQENVEIVRLAYVAFSERDLDALEELTDPNWVSDSPSFSRVASTKSSSRVVVNLPVLRMKLPRCLKLATAMR